MTTHFVFSINVSTKVIGLVEFDSIKISPVWSLNQTKNSPNYPENPLILMYFDLQNHLPTQLQLLISLKDLKWKFWIFVWRLVWVIFLLNFSNCFATFQEAHNVQKKPCQPGIKTDILCNYRFGFVHQNRKWKLHLMR